MDDYDRNWVTERFLELNERIKALEDAQSFAPKITTLSTLSVAPGEAIVVAFENEPSEEDHKVVMDCLRRSFGSGVRFIIHGPTVTLKKMTAKGEETDE